MKRRLSKILVATLCALAIILHIYVHLTPLDFASIMESRRLKIQSYCVDHGFSARKDFKDVCGKMGLQVRGTKGKGGYNKTKIVTFSRC